MIVRKYHMRALAARTTWAARLLLVTAALVFFTSAAIPVSAAATAATRLRYANFPAADTFPSVAMERWAAEIQARGNGTLTIETFPGGTLLDAKNMVRGVMQGQADIGCISLAYHPGAYPLLSVFELPLGFKTARAASEALWNTYKKFQPAEVGKVVVIGLFTSAPSQIMSIQPLHSPEDIQGLTLRSSGTLADVAAALGASPVSMPQSDAPEALQKGTVKGVFSSLDVLKDYNFAESCRYGMIVDMPVYPFMVFMNRKKWDSLSPEAQKAIMDIALEHSVWTGDYVDDHGKKARRWAEDTYGVKLTELTPEQKTALMRKAGTVVDAWKKRAQEKNINADEILDFVRAEHARLEP